MKKTVRSGLLLGAALLAHLTGSAQNLPIILQPGATLTLPAGASPSAVAVSDFNQDQRADVAVCERGLDQVAVYLQTPTGTFPSPAATYPTGRAPSGLVTFNGNPTGASSPDLVAVSGPSSRWTMLRNKKDGTGAFTSVLPFYGFGSGAPSLNPQLIAADVDHDRYTDFAYTYDAPMDRCVRWDSYIGGQQMLNRPDQYSLYFTPSSLAVDDFDRDGHGDVVITDPVNNEVLVLISPNFGAWAASRVTYLPMPNGGQRPQSVSAGDVTADLLPDLAVALEGSNEVTVFLNLNYNHFGAAFSYPLAASPRKVLLADLNGDRFPELLVITADNRLVVYQHSQTSASTCFGHPQTLATGVNPLTLQVAYLNDDPYPDIVVGCPGDNTVHTYLNRTFGTPTAMRAPALTDVEVYPTRATDQVTIRQVVPRTLTATLLDEVGRAVRQQVLTQPTTVVATGELPRGLYLLRLAGEAGTRTTRVVLQ